MTEACPLLALDPVPPGWRIHRVADLVELTNGYPFDSNAFGPEGDLPVVRIRDLLADEFTTYVTGPVPESAVLQDGDIVIGMDGDFELVVWRRGPAALNQRLCLLRARPGVDARFVAYVLPGHLRVLNDLTHATTVKHLSSFDVLSDRIGCPPLPIQVAIADYLDAETRRIDEIAKRRDTQVGVLQSHVRASIDRELDDVPMRWRLKHLLARPLEYGANETGQSDEPSWPRYIRTTDFDDRGELRPDTFRSLPPSIAAPFALADGDLLLTRSGTVGKSLRWHHEWGPACFAGYLIRARPDPSRVFADYLAYFFQSTRYWEEIGLATIQATIPNVNAERYGELPIPLPSLADQAVIVARLDQVRDRSRAVAVRLIRQIDLLRERRHALITAAVTGQLEIPGVAP